MATCKNCLYYEKLCFHTLEPHELKLCKDFKDKSNFIEVVRCKNCKNSTRWKNTEDEKMVQRYCHIHSKFTGDNHYCSYGEKRIVV